MKFPSTPSFDLSGKRALVTGASSGIGLACATALAEHGAEVTLAARSGNKLRAIVDGMTGEGWRAISLELDVSDVQATKAVVAENGPFDILLNSAGFAKHSPAIQTTEDDFDAVADLNIKGAYFLTSAVADGLIKRGKTWGPKGIRVNTICPTFIVTPLTKQTFDRPERRAWVEDKIKLGRIGEVEDIMGAAVFLASDASALITGSALMIDGGWTAD